MARKESNIKKVFSFLLANWQFILLLPLVFSVLRFFKSSKEPSKVVYSKNERVNNAIFIIDSCINKFGTFDSDLEPIFEVLNDLNADEIRQLHKDFGVRYYNSLTFMYSSIQFLEGYAFARPLNFSAIIYKEFDNNQINRLKAIYKSKGVHFPL